MQFPAFLLLITGVLFIQTTVIDLISIYGIKPDLIMLLVIFNGFLLGTREGAFLGFAGGVLEDLFTGNYIGLNALCKMAAGYLAGAFGAGFYKENTVIATGVTFVSTAAAMVLNYLLLFFVDIHVSPLNALLKVILPVAAYTALLSPFFYGRFAHRVLKVLARDI